MSERKREVKRKVNIINVGINFLMFYCGRRTTARYSIGENIYVHVNILIAAFCVENVLRSILNRYMVGHIL